MSKIFASASEVPAGVVKDGQTIAVGGSDLCGTPGALIVALRDSSAGNLTYISNNAGVDSFGLGLLLETRQIKKMISSYMGKNKEFERQYLIGKLELEFAPQDALAEKLHVGGAGIPAFFIKMGTDTLAAEGRELRESGSETHVMEHSLVLNVALVKVQVANEPDNLRFNLTVRNFNPTTVTTGRICIVEVEEITGMGELAPDNTRLSGIYVHRIILNAMSEKRIEKRIIRAAN